MLMSPLILMKFLLNYLWFLFMNVWNQKVSRRTYQDQRCWNYCRNNGSDEFNPMEYKHIIFKERLFSFLHQKGTFLIFSYIFTSTII